MKRVFRVENDEGRGLYRICDSYWLGGLFGVCDAEGNDRHPSPWSDKSDLGKFWNDASEQEAENWYFGFSSLAQLRQWLPGPKARQKLAERELKVTVYEMEDADFRQGERQAIFVKERAKPVKTLSIRSLRSAA